MSNQPKTLQLADKLGRLIQSLRRTPMPLADVIPYLIEAADELRRLHAENEALRKANDDLARAAIAKVEGKV